MPPTPRTEPTEAEVSQAAAVELENTSSDARDSTYEPYKEEEPQNPPAGPGVVQTRGKAK
jgi:hypothetical protein